LDQTFEDFELIVSDNASTDRTADICYDFAARDPRVRYCRLEANRGITQNHNHAFSLARGTYVMWLGHDDLLRKDYLSKCVESLQGNAEAVLCFSYIRRVDGEGNLLREVKVPNDGASSRPSERFRSIIRPNQRADAMYGLMRRATLSQTQLHGDFTGSDVILLAEMGLRGRFTLIPEFLFSRRIHRFQHSLRSSDARVRTISMDPNKKGKIILPQFRRTKEYLLAIKRAEVPFKERLACYKYVIEWIWMCRRNLQRDIVLEIEPRMHRYLPKQLISVIVVTKRLFFKQSWLAAPQWEDD
jgi:glycosyltransferase involved in cell wall biosynthesis